LVVPLRIEPVPPKKKHATEFTVLKSETKGRDEGMKGIKYMEFAGFRHKRNDS
jgi:hypothetical protein